LYELEVIIFGSVRFLYKKKVIKPKKIKKKQKTKTGSNRPVLVRFGFFGQKPVQTGLTWFFQFCSVFSVRFSLVFSVSGL